MFDAAALTTDRAPRRSAQSRSAAVSGLVDLPDLSDRADTVEQRDADVIALRPVGFQPGHAPSARQAQGHTVELRLLGGFRLLVDGELTHVGLTGQRLLVLLACRGRLATRSQIAYALWPDSPSARAHANLRTGLYRLIRACPDAIQATTSHLRLPASVQIDFEQSTQLAKTIIGSDAMVDDALLRAALQANFDDDLLPDWDEDWISDVQYRYRQLRLTTLETLSQHLGAAGHHGAAVQTALAAVQADVLRDSAHERLIRACLAQGNRHEAHHHYRSYRRILRDELGMDPPTTLGRLLTSA
jgi:DNA-binding SARP family transcriptional activator